ncbi:3-oxoacyl-[acyl-carrier-protein] synthase [Actinobacillus suis H91-0380]|uniref:3-oxoacyl-[acyl-carrier-protein] synthase n=2 Tax=Actinobacillus suis TaxID=716 RepID=K0GEA9_ACTSU|nr:3-oxoacyl-[acyl-carrier-protein] synthase [Actinobacillus suis H91-0380]AIJ32189.1 3-oxoacyl-[acyl-carrier-protein] synthase [Actinobacillus suis ATCC 33415]SNV39392.1 3-oxoacyl-[acyl-carrier-protein] synthase [Actinobacillus suis]
MKLFLSRPAMISALGDDLNTHLDVLLNNKPSPLAATDIPYSAHGIIGQEKMLGEVKETLREFPVDLPAEHRSRNNQLLWHVLAQIEPQIEQVITRFGKQRVAVVMGTSTTGVDENIPVFQYAAEHNDWSGKPFWQQQQYFSAPADFVAYQYGVQSASYGISTACTSGARALISAARLLKANLCDAVICGGVDTLSPLTISGFSSLEVLSDQRTNPLSANRNGINIGEAATAFIMTREAIDEHRIELLGYGASSDAYHMSSPHPEGIGAISAFENALKSAALLANQIGWINLHGTGTVHNDQMETLAVAKVFGNHTACTTTKPYTGHTLGAAGALEAAILWAVISRTYNPQGILPPQLWDGMRDESLPEILITDEHSRWLPGRRLGASSSFAFGGNNAVLILGESE